MAFAAHPVSSLPRVPALPSWVASAAALGLCAVAAAALVPPAVASMNTTPAPESVSVHLSGTVSTAGLPLTPAVSSLVISNAGTGAISWSARPAVTGPGATGVRIDTWPASGVTCAQPAVTTPDGAWSTAALAPGGSLILCVRVSATGTAAGQATPTVTVVARPA